MSFTTKKLKKYFLKTLTSLCAVALILGIMTPNSVHAQTESYLPKNPATNKIIVFDLSHDLKNHDAGAKEAYMAITSIQGIVNRTSSTKIYLTHTPQEHDWDPYPADQSWLDNGLIPAEKEYPSLNYGKKYPVLSYLLNQYSDFLKGKIQVPPLSGNIIDGAIMAGVTAAGIEDSILVSPDIEKYIENEGYNFKSNANTRGFKSNIEAFDWAYDNYFEKCNKTFAAQHTFTAFGGGMEDQFPIMYDYYISSRVFVFCLDGNKENELAKLQSFLIPENYSLGTAVLGLPVDEGKGISCISNQGYYFAIMYIPNLTVTSSFKYDPSTIQEPAQPTAMEVDNNTNYVAFFATDGDSMGFPTNFMYEKITNSPARGEIPIGWSFNPHLIDIFPTLLSYYSKNNYNTFYEYVASMNNGGSPKNDEAYKVFRDRYIDYVEKSNGMFRTMNYFNEDEYVNSLVSAINPYLLIKGYQGAEGGNDTQWGKIPETNISFTTMSGATQGGANIENIYKALNRIATNKEENTPTFTIVCVGDGRWSQDSAINVKEAIKKLQQENLNSNFTFMRPSDLAATYNHYKGDKSVNVGNPKVVSFNNENEVDKIVADKDKIELNEGSTTSIKGFALDEKGQYIPNKSIQYSIENSDIAQIDNNGNITGKQGGETVLTLSCDGKESKINIKVIAKVPSSIAVDKQEFSTAVNGQATITATLYDQFGNVLPTPEYKWESQNKSIVTVNNGLITGVGRGQTTVTVSYGTLKTIINITVLESSASIDKIVIDPSYMEMYPNDIYKVKVNAYDSDNNEVFGFPPEWSIKDKNIAKIDEKGYITGLKPGQTSITATYDGQATHSIDLLVKEDNRTMEKFEKLQGYPHDSKFDHIVFEAGFDKATDKGQIDGQAIKLEGNNEAKTVFFKEQGETKKQVLKSMKVYNPSDKVINISLKGNDTGSMTYQIEPKRTITLKTNWNKKIESFVISRSDTTVDIAFGEFVYGEADPIATTLKISPNEEQITIFKDGSLNLNATLYDQNGKEMPTDYLEWSTDRDDIVKIDKNGKITGVNVGSTFIYAKANGLVTSMMVYVTESDIDHIEVKPETITFYVNDILPLSAQAFNKENQLMTSSPVFESNDENIVKIINGHYAKAVGEGTTTIKANVSGKEASITVYVKEHPESDQIITFDGFENNYKLTKNDIINERVSFEDGFFQIAINAPEIKGNTVHFPDENTGEKAFWIKPKSTIKSVKVYNPTNQAQNFIIKELNTGNGLTLPNVETVIQPGETRTIFTGYKEQVEGFVFQTFWQVQVGEIVYTDTLETGFTAQDIVDGINSIKQPTLGETKLELPQIDGFEMTISKSSNEDIISLDGTINPLGIDQEVEIVVQVKKQRNSEDIAYTTPIKVKILGIPADKAELREIIENIKDINLSQYKPSSITALNKVLEKAKEALNNQELRQSDIDKIVKEVNETITKLEKKADKSVLQDLINHIYGMNLSEYTPQSVDALKPIINEALKLLKDEEANQKNINQMIEKLNTNIKQLQRQAKKDELTKIYEKYSKLDLAKYTNESSRNLSNILIKAKEIIENPNVSQSDVDQMIKDIQSAYEKLEEKKDIIINTENPKDNVDDDNNLQNPNPSNNSTHNTNSNVQTYDQNNILLYAVLLISSFLSLLLIRKKNKL